MASIVERFGSAVSVVVIVVAAVVWLLRRRYEGGATWASLAGLPTAWM